MKHFSFQYKRQLFKVDDCKVTNTESHSPLLLATFRMETFMEEAPVYQKVVGY